MKFIKKNDLVKNEKLFKKVNEFIENSNLVDLLIKNYGAFPEIKYDCVARNFISNKILVQLVPFFYIFDENLYQKNILDLGCGSIGGTYESIKFNPVMYEPWFCRALHKLGANSIGVDVGRLDNEKFKHYHVNLLSSDSLNFLNDNSIDAVNVDLLFNSPTLEQMDDFKNLRSLLIPQLKRIVKKEGVFFE